ncbi:MAG: alpha/beta hydrolase [Pseudomonadota bacterium]
MRRRSFIIGMGALGGGAMITKGCATTPPITDEAREAALAAEAQYPPIGRIVPTAFGAVHATDQGRGDAPPVVLIHGASGNVRDWTFGIAEPLAAKRRVIAMDRPGFGYSERIGEEMWRPARQAAQLHAAAKAMGVEKPILVGHSWGASVALAWAEEHPDDVTGVVSVSGVTQPWGGVVPLLDTLGFGNLIAGWYSRRLSRTAETGGVEDFIRRAFRPQTPPSGYVDYVGGPLAVREKTLKANAEDLAKTNPAVTEVAAKYPSIKVPVEIMHGDSDWLLDIEQHGVATASDIPTARLTPLPGVGHMAHHARTDVLGDLIEKLSA